MNFIQRYYINKQLTNSVKKRKNKEIKISPFDTLKNICVFATYHGDEKYKELIEGINYLEKKGKKVSIFYFLNQKKIPEVMSNKLDINFIYKKDISFTGLINNHAQKELGKQHYDIFIDTDTRPDKLSLFLKTFINTDLRVGRNEKYYDYYDLTLCVDEKHTIKEYFLNLETYITKLQGN
jgi:hypothetical protein